MKMQKKLEEYDNVNELANDIQKNLDALATDLQYQIQKLHNRLYVNYKIAYKNLNERDYAVAHTQDMYKMEGLEIALNGLNKHFRTDYEINCGIIAENDTKPVRKK